jgi:hypothetical protein
MSYRKRLEQDKAIVGRACTLTRNVTTVGHATYLAGSRWRIFGTWRGRFSIESIGDDGSTELTANGCIAHLVRQVERDALYLEPEDALYTKFNQEYRKRRRRRKT